MDNFTYCTPTRYVFGRGVELKAGEEAVNSGMKKALVVYGGGSAVRSGLLKKVTDCLSAAGVEFVELGGVQPIRSTLSSTKASTSAAVRESTLS